MKVSNEGIVALVLHEGIVPAPYLDSVNVWTYGIGHTAAAGFPDPRKLPKGMPKDLDAEIKEIVTLFQKDLARYTKDVLKAVKVELEQHELDALVSFHYNTGAIAKATLTKQINAGDKKEAANSFMNWIKPPEIEERRSEEKKLFEKGIYPTGDIIVWQVSTRGKVIWKPAKKLKPVELLELLTNE